MTARHSPAIGSQPGRAATPDLSLLVLCESRVLAQKNDGIELDEPDDYDFTGSPESIDRALRQISAALAERDVTIGELAEKFWDANGWRRVRYATAAQYARERLGMSLLDQRQGNSLVARADSLI